MRASIIDTEFSENTADVDGEAIHTEAFFGETNMYLRGCSFSENSAGDWGGAVYTNSNTAEIHECSFEGNEANYGGAILSDFSFAAISRTMFDCNEAYEEGGAILYEFGEIEISEAAFKGNKARGGGALSLDYVNTIEISSCLLDGNEATDYGGGAIWYSSISPLTFSTNGTVFQNSKSLNPTESSDDIFDVNDEQNIQCGSGSGNCFCDADTSPSVDQNITTNDLPTTCAGAGTGPDCVGCSQTAPSLCSAISRTEAPEVVRTRSETNPLEVSRMSASLMKDIVPPKSLADLPAGMMSDRMVKIKEKMDQMKEKQMEKMGGR